jgi:membrane protease YdiL (CAAX protease family)
MQTPPREASWSLVLAILVEGGLGVVALVAGWLLGHWPAIGMSLEPDTFASQLQAIGLGIAATIPLLAALAAADHWSLPAVSRVRDQAERAVRQIFPRPRWWQLALVSAAAGFGEELLFRGLLQAGLAELLPVPYATWIGLIAASLVFGAFHWLSTTYAILATLAGLYFGCILMYTDSLWSPIIAHGLYDFLALSYLLAPNKTIG